MSFYSLSYRFIFESEDEDMINNFHNKLIYNVLSPIQNPNTKIQSIVVSEEMIIFES